MDIGNTGESLEIVSRVVTAVHPDKEGDIVIAAARHHGLAVLDALDQKRRRVCTLAVGLTWTKIYVYYMRSYVAQHWGVAHQQFIRKGDAFLV